jgi:hypothetical protein
VKKNEGYLIVIGAFLILLSISGYAAYKIFETGDLSFLKSEKDN